MLRYVAAIALAILAAQPQVAAAEVERDRSVLARVLPGADHFGVVAGTPPAIEATLDGERIGYVLFTRDVIGSVGFAGKPLDVAVGLDLAGVITGAEIIEHHEPILVIGVSTTDLDDFAAQFRGIDIRATPRFEGVDTQDTPLLDAVSGATVSSLIINDAIVRATRAVARTRGILGGTAAAIDLDSFAPASWLALTADNALVRRNVKNAEIDAALRDKGASGFGPEGVVRDPAATFIDLYAALATPAAIGRNLLDARTYDRLMAELQPGGQLVFIGASGLYSFKGTAWRRSGSFERIQLVQGERSWRLSEAQHRRIEDIAAAGAPELREAAVFVMPPDAGFDPAKPWRLDLLVAADSAQGAVFVRYSLDYRLPTQLILAGADAPDAPTPLWVETWRNSGVKLAVLMIALGVLTAILFFQDLIARRPRLYHWLRYSFLGFTLVWLGWYAGVQLSVVNVLTFSQALLGEFQWEVFLVAPLLFILWSFVAIALLFWGRGVFCGWLCPFGALQELLYQAARLLHIPKLTIPFALHERLWPIKYVIFIGLFAASLGSFDRVQLGVEIEPFKTAIILGFVRDWPFVVYAVLLLYVGLYIERAFCRYLCPLGAALAIPARLRMFEWLKRRRQCGVQCRLCAVQCTVQAIHPDGHINPNECIHCLNCQMVYYDNRTCPPLMERRKRREGARRVPESVET